MSAFLSDDYFAAAKDALAADPGFRNAAANVDLSVEFLVTDGPVGDATYFVAMADGEVHTALGGKAGADVTVASDYATAAAISKGELNVQMAFMTGKIKVGGNMAKIMMYQGVLNEYARVLSGLDVEY